MVCMRIWGFLVSDWYDRFSREELIEKLRACWREFNEIECVLGDALGYGRIPADGPAPGSPNVGDHVPASLALEASQALKDLGYVRGRPSG